MSSALSFDLDIVPLTPQHEQGIFNCGDSFDVKVRITPNQKAFSHKGIVFEFISILVPDSGKTIPLTTPIQIPLVESGTLSGTMECQLPQLTIPANIQTYHGELFNIKHILRFVAKKSFGQSVEYTEEIKAFAYVPCVTKLQPLCVRVAVTENIRIDLLINRRRFELRDVILGGAHFLLVALKITKFEVSLVAQEVFEQNGKPIKHKNVIRTWQITDGAPIKGEIIPFRLFLSPLNLTPSCVDQTMGYSVSHFLHFIVYTTSRQKYFKSLQIKLAKFTSMPFAIVD
jgi:vacuolar protein sorting-associated protein 26